MMKKITRFSYLRLIVLFALISGSVSAQCIRTDMYPFSTIASTNTGLLQNISDCNYTDFEYAQVNGLLVGQDYEFIIRSGSTYGSGTHRYVTVTNNSNIVIAHGPSPLTVTSITSASVRIHYSNNAACTGEDECHNTQFRMIDATTQVPGCVSGPTPANNAINVPVGDVEFSWTAPTTGDAPTAYLMYYGLSSDDVTNLVGEFTTTEVDITLSGFNTVFYWKIVPVNAGGEATGCPVWSFTTEEAPGYCLVADGGLYPFGSFTPSECDGVTENEITDNAWAGEYSVVNVVSGQTYVFGSSVSTDFITIANAAGTVPLEYGITPVTWVSDVTGTVRFYNHADDECGNEEEARSRYVICGVPTSDEPDYVSLQWPPSMTLDAGTSGTVYGQVFEAGLTDVAPLTDQAPGIQAWVGVSPEGQNTNPATWTTWVPAVINPDHVSNNDEYMAEIGASLAPGTYYYATRFRLNGGTYVYGGIDADDNGNFWNGTSYNSGVLTINPIANDECADAIALAVGSDFEAGAVAVTNTGASGSDADPLPDCDEYEFEVNGTDIWFTVTVPASGNITFETRENGDDNISDTGLEVYSGTCGSLVSLGCNADDGEGNFSLLELEGQVPGSTLLVRVWGYNGTSGNFNISAYDETDPCEGVGAPEGDEDQELIEGQTLADLDVTGDNLTWYTDEALQNEVPDTTVAENGITYYVTQTVGECVSDMLAVEVTVTDPCDGVGAPEGDEDQELMAGQTLADLDVTGDNLTWYTDEALQNEVPDTTVAEDGITYYVTQTVGDCVSGAFAVTVSMADPCEGTEAPEGDEEQFLATGQTLADLLVTGENLTWYADEELSAEIPDSTVGADGVTYYVTQTIGECVSEALAVTVTINDIGSTGGFDKAAFKYYPNPVTDVLNISYTAEISTVAVINLLGQQVYSQRVDAVQAQVNLSHLPEGSYLVRVTAGGVNGTVKIIKK